MTSSGPPAADTKIDCPKSRGWEPWNYETISLFFDALKQHGKDFVLIRKYIMRKSKNGAKNYDQVRNFYYNKCVTVLNRLNLTDINAPKEAKELFTLIGYGELIKKTKSIKMSPQNFNAALTDLVKNGCTIVKMKPSQTNDNSTNSNIKKHMNHKKSTGPGPKPNKIVKIKIKIPPCEALKKFIKQNKQSPSKGKQRESISDSVFESESVLPKLVDLELVPKTMGDKACVLDCHQNPLVRFSLSLNQPVSRIFTWLRAKWMPKNAKERKNFDEENFDDLLPNVTLYPPNDIQLKCVLMAPKRSAELPIDRLGLRHCFDQISTNQNQDKSLKTPNHVTKESQQGQQGSKLKPAGAVLLLSLDQSGEGHVIVENEGHVIDSYNDVPTTDDEVEVLESDPSKCLNDEPEFRENGPPEPNLSKDSSLTLNPEILRGGLTVENCGGLTIGQLCLMCNGSPNLRFLYKIDSKIGDKQEISPPWLCFVKLIRQNFVDILHKKLNDQPVKRRAPSIIKCKPNIDDHDDVIDTDTPSTSTNGHPWTKTAKRKRFTPPAQQQYPVVFEENQAFLLQYQQMFGSKKDENNKIHRPISVTRRQTIPNTTASVITSAALSPTCSTPIQGVGNQMDHGQGQGQGQAHEPANANNVTNPMVENCCTLVYSTPATILAIPVMAGSQGQGQAQVVTVCQPNNGTLVNLPVMTNGENAMVQTTVPTTVVTQTPRPEPTSFASILHEQVEMTPELGHNQHKLDSLHVDVVPTTSHVPILSDFSFSSTNSLFGFLSSQTPQKKGNQADCSSNLHNFDFSLDSVKSVVNLNNSEDTVLQRDVRRSFELMMHQDSSEYCKNFADLAGNLETPKKNFFLDDHNI